MPSSQVIGVVKYSRTISTVILCNIKHIQPAKINKIDELFELTCWFSLISWLRWLLDKCKQINIATVKNSIFHNWSTRSQHVPSLSIKTLTKHLSIHPSIHPFTHPFMMTCSRALQHNITPCIKQPNSLSLSDVVEQWWTEQWWHDLSA